MGRAFDLFIKEIILRITIEDYDAVIAITGDEGVGKSSLAYWIAKFTDKAFTLLRNCLFNPTVIKLLEIMRRFPRFSCIWLDEAVDVVYKMDFASKKTRTIIKEFTKDRSMNRVKLIVIPRFTDLAENLRNHRVLYHLHCFERGYAAVLKKHKSMGGKDPWNLKEGDKRFKELRQRRDPRVFTSGKFDYFKCLKLAYPHNVVGLIKWDKMPDEDWKQYNIYKDDANIETLKEYEVTESIRFRKEKGYTRRAIEYLRRLGYSKEVIYLELGVPPMTQYRRAPLEKK